MNKKASGPVRQASVLQSWQDDNTLNEEVVDEIDSEENEHYATLSEHNHYSTLRKANNSSSSRHQRNTRNTQLSHFSQFSRLPPVPERPSLENRELSPVPDIVSPTSPILAQSYHNQNTYSEPRNTGHRAMRQESLSPRTVESSTTMAGVHTLGRHQRHKSR